MFADAGEDYADTHLLILPVPLSRDGVHVQSGCAQAPLCIRTLAEKLPQDAAEAALRGEQLRPLLIG